MNEEQIRKQERLATLKEVEHEWKISCRLSNFSKWLSQKIKELER